MEVADLPLDQLREALWNPNQMGEEMLAKLRRSITRYGLVENLVVRPHAGGTYEVLSGNQRVAVLREMGFTTAPCVVIDVDDANARLLAQALNRIQGEDALGLRAELVRDVLAGLPKDEVLNLLPETVESLNTLASMGKETLAVYLENWQKAQAARLKHLQFQLTPGQLEVVEEALAQVLPVAKQERDESPNARGIALYLLCKDYLGRKNEG